MSQVSLNLALLALCSLLREDDLEVWVSRVPDHMCAVCTWCPSGGGLADTALWWLSQEQEEMDEEENNDEKGEEEEKEEDQEEF